MSLHKKDWLKIAGLLGLGATGLGAAGIGPMAGLLGPAALGTATGAAGMGELASVGATGSTMMGGELGLLSGLNMDKGLKGLQLANSFMQQGQPQQQQPAARPPMTQQQLMSQTDLEKLLKRIYGGMYG